MAFMMLYRCVILFTISLKDNVLANACENDSCKAAIDIPLITKLNAPLKAELDIFGLTTQLKELIGNEVKKAVSVAMTDLAENIVDKRTQFALENLQTYNNRTISTFLQELEDVTAGKQDLSTIEEKIQGKIEQLRAQHKLTESKLSNVESEVIRTTRRVAMTAHASSSGTVSAIMKFDNVKYSVGITNLSSYKNTGKFIVEHEGLYLISASVMSHTVNAFYYIRLNGNNVSQTYIGGPGDSAVTGAVIVTRKLNTNDQIWLQAAGSWYIYDSMFSTLTIIKIK